jgi:hypothetical protein
MKYTIHLGVPPFMETFFLNETSIFKHQSLSSWRPAGTVFRLRHAAHLFLLAAIAWQKTVHLHKQSL